MNFRHNPWRFVRRDTVTQRVERYETRITRLNWVGAGLLAIIALGPTIALANYSRWMLAVWITLVLACGALLALAMVGFQHRARQLRSQGRDTAIRGKPRLSLLKEAGQSGTSRRPDDTRIREEARWPKPVEQKYVATLAFIVIVGSLTAIMSWVTAFGGSPAGDTSNGGGDLLPPVPPVIPELPEGGSWLTSSLPWLAAIGLAFLVFWLLFQRRKPATGLRKWLEHIAAILAIFPVASAAAVSVLGVWEKWKQVSCIECPAKRPCDDRRPEGGTCPDPIVCPRPLPCPDCEACADCDRDGKGAFYLTFKEAACDDPTPTNWTGVNVEENERTALDALVSALKACHVGPPVSVEVWGFSSSSEFRNPGACGVASDKEANVLIAQMRAEGVGKLLKGALGEGAVIVQNWDGSFDTMASHRGFNDRVAPGGDYSKEAGKLNRRVEIRIRNAGACKVLAKGRATRS